MIRINRCSMLDDRSLEEQPEKQQVCSIKCDLNQNVIHQHDLGIMGKSFHPGLLLLLIFLLTSNTYSFAQPVKISASIDSSNIVIGDQINLKLSATYNPQLYRVSFPSLPDTFNHFEVVDRSKMDTVIGRDENTFKQNIIITNFDSGQWKIPPMIFDVQPLKGDAPSELLSDSFLVNVNTVQVDTSKPIKPIFGIRGAKMPIQQVLLYILGALLIAALLGFLIWYFIKTLREKNKKPEFKEPEIVLLPHEKAMQQLEQLSTQQLWQSGQEKQYHTYLTDIVRTYLEEQFKIDCFDKTSSEIIQQVKKIKALSTSRQNLRFIFDTADMVKFAKSKPTADEHIQSLELAKEMILESYKKVKPIVNNTEGEGNTN